MRILIVNKNWLGDMLFQIPAIEAVKANWPQAEIVCAAPSRCRAMVAAHPAVTRFLTFDERNEQRTLKARLAWSLAMRREKWDLALFFHGSRTRSFWVWLGGVRRRIGCGSDRSWLLTQTVAEPQGTLHEVDYFMEILRGAGIPVPPRASYRFYFSDKDGEAARELAVSNGLHRGGYLCFHLGANWNPKRWPLGHFAALSREVYRRWSVPIAVTGGREDQGLAKRLASECQGVPLVLLAGKTSLGMLAALFHDAAAVVSADSGPMHIAAGSGARVIALFGPTDPQRTGPRGIGESVVIQHVPSGFHVPWTEERMPEGGWMSGIRPEQVLEVLEKKKWVRPAARTGGR